MFVISMDIIFIARPKSDYSTIEKMRDAISFWKMAYDNGWFDTKDGQKFLRYYQKVASNQKNKGYNVKFVRRQNFTGGFGEYEPASEFQPTDIINGIPVKPSGRLAEDGQIEYVDQKGDAYTKEPLSFQTGGIIEQLNNLSPDKLQELEHILKYLNQ